MAETYDAIVIGARHNGLTCVCHLAKAGLRTLMLEPYRTSASYGREQDPPVALRRFAVQRDPQR
jgi:glycine/D-amino acid oxidase-like deaminating enzyme